MTLARTTRVCLPLFVLPLCALLACQSLPFPEPHLEGNYGELLRRWTRESEVYQGLETRAFVQVVFLAPPLVDAQSELVADVRAEPAPARARTLARMRAAAATPTFFAVVRTPDRNWNDLDSKTSVWRIAIDYGAGQFEPASVVRMEQPWSAELQTLYPYLDEYSVAYEIRFPAAATPPPAGSSVQPEPALTIAGVLGQMKFDWSVPRS